MTDEKNLPINPATHSWWLLDDDLRPYPVTMERFLEDGVLNPERRIIKQDRPDEGVLISTVFLGINHSFDFDGPPILFETMVFIPGGESVAQARASTAAEAIQNHEKYLAWYFDWAKEQGWRMAVYRLMARIKSWFR